jgi:hypothetical protein
MTLTWRDVLDHKGWPVSIDAMYDLALATGYQYFNWNDRIYRVGVGGTHHGVDTGLTVKDVC